MKRNIDSAIKPRVRLQFLDSETGEEGYFTSDDYTIKYIGRGSRKPVYHVKGENGGTRLAVKPQAYLGSWTLVISETGEIIPPNRAHTIIIEQDEQSRQTGLYLVKMPDGTQKEAKTWNQQYRKHKQDAKKSALENATNSNNSASTAVATSLRSTACPQSLESASGLDPTNRSQDVVIATAVKANNSCAYSINNITHKVNVALAKQPRFTIWDEKNTTRQGDSKDINPTTMNLN